MRRRLPRVWCPGRTLPGSLRARRTLTNRRTSKKKIAEIAGNPCSGALLGGAPEGIRTPNLLIRSQMLYPLSYGRWCLVSLHDRLSRGDSGIRTREGL